MELGMVGAQTRAVSGNWVLKRTIYLNVVSLGHMLVYQIHKNQHNKEGSYEVEIEQTLMT